MPEVAAIVETVSCRQPAPIAMDLAIYEAFLSDGDRQLVKA